MKFNFDKARKDFGKLKEISEELEESDEITGFDLEEVVPEVKELLKERDIDDSDPFYEMEIIKATLEVVKER